jgi:hypothetical protein
MRLAVIPPKIEWQYMDFEEEFQQEQAYLAEHWDESSEYERRRDIEQLILYAGMRGLG